MLGPVMCNFVTSMVVILLSASIYHFVAVNIDRWKGIPIHYLLNEMFNPRLTAIKFPMSYRSPENRQRIKLVIGMCWLLSLLPAAPMWIPKFDSRYLLIHI